jgi:hypothetical protein
LKDTVFAVFRNKNSDLEFATQLVRDAKGIIFEPDKR